MMHDMSHSRSKNIDPRVFIGVVIVGIAAVVGYLLFSAASSTTTMYLAKTTLIPGHILQEKDILPADVHLGNATSSYLTAGDMKPGMVVTMTVAAGELIPVNAISTAAKLETTNVVIELAVPLPHATEIGSFVDIWASMALGQGVFGPPSVLISGAQVAHISEPTGFASAGSGVNVEVVVPLTAVAAVLEAQANGDALSLVPTHTGSLWEN